MPMAFMGLGLLLIVILLPSALRPPAPQTNQTAQLSPDAPPDKTDSIIATLQRAGSGTAGTGSGSGASIGPVSPTGTPPNQPPPAAPPHPC